MKKSAPESRPLTSSSSDVERIPQFVSENIYSRMSQGRPSRYIRSNWRQTGRVNRLRREGSDLYNLWKWLGDDGYLITPKLTDLDPELSDDPAGRFDTTFVDRCFQAARRRIRGPFYMVLEVGKGDYRKEGIGRLHPHIVAHRQSVHPRLRRDGERYKPIGDFWGLIRYLNKAEPYSYEDHIEFLAAKTLSEFGRLPKLRRTYCGPQRLAWVPPLHLEPNALPKTGRSPLFRRGLLRHSRNLAQHKGDGASTSK